MSKLYVYLAIGAAVIGGLIWYTLDQRSIGGSAERERQVKANAKFVVNAKKGAVDYDTCDLAGGLYDFGKGTCKLP